MRTSWGSLVFGFGFAGMALAGSLAGCGATGTKPMVGEEGALPDGGTPVSVGDGGGKDSGGKGAVPATCSDTFKSGKETDVDCGGSECLGCIDGKGCIAATDCLGGACLPQTKVCATPACSDKERNGDETDQDCGGSICKRCTTGKQCKAATDCVSGACDTARGQCACPKGMAIVSRAGGGGAYCVDEIEVTKFQYNKFVTANVPTTDQIDVCKPPVNTNFVPRGAFPPAIAPPSGLGEGIAEGFNNALPVHYVDWCDAYAYCKWANKQLCADVTGVTADFTKPNDPAVDAWYNACSAQGVNTYGYSSVFVSGKCNGGEGLAFSGDAQTGPGEALRNGYGAASNQDEGVHYVNNGDRTGNYTKIEFGQCNAGTVGIYHMVGNVAEWEDSCDTAGNCRVRGGSYKAGTNNSAALACGASRTEVRVPPPPAGSAEDALKDIGFRCCLY